jgi:ankyrin repeat protein
MTTIADELRIAAMKGNCGKLRELLDGGGASVDERTEATDAKGKFKTTALIQAVTHDQHSAVDLLLGHSANPNLADSFGCSPLMTAAGLGHLHILRTLLDRKDIAIDAVDEANNGTTAFHYACFKGNADCAVELAGRGCDTTLRTKRGMNGMTGWDIAERKQHTAVLAGLRALVVEQLQARQVQEPEGTSDTHGEETATPTVVITALRLREAAQHGDCGKLRELLSDGDGATAVDERTEVVDNRTGRKAQVTALIMAVSNDRPAAVDLLLEHGADRNRADSRGCTPLMNAAGLGHLRILHTLLEHEAIIDAVEPIGGATAFHYACFNSRADCAVELARSGCDTMLRDKDGRTGKQLAERQKHTAVLVGLRALVVEQLRSHDDHQQSSDATGDQQQDNSFQPEGTSDTHGEETATPTVVITALRLREAAQHGDCGKLRELLDGGGASLVNERTEAMDPKTGKKVQVTALIEAVAYNQHAAVELLLEHGAKPNLADSIGFTPLISAAACGYLPILRTLLDRQSIAIDAVNPKDGGTAFHMACSWDQVDSAVELVLRGCDTKLTTHGNETGWDIAKRKEYRVLIRRCKLTQKLALRKALQQGNITIESPAPATDANVGTAPQVHEDPEEQAKAAKKAATNRKKKERKKAKKASVQQQLLLLSQAEAKAEAETAAEVEAELEPEPAPALEEAGVDTEPVLQVELKTEADDEGELTEPQPELDEHTQQLQSLTALGVQQWSAAQVLEWVALAALPPESVSVVSAAIESLDLDGEELLDLRPKILHKLLLKHGAQDAEALAKQVMQQRDALLMLPENSTVAAPAAADRLECPICMELFCDDASGLLVPRLLTNCGHTVCHGCITDMLALVTTTGKKKNKKNDGAKSCKCPTCSKVTEVKGGDAATLFRNFAVV